MGNKAFSDKKYSKADSLYALSTKYKPHKDTYFNWAAVKEKLNDKKGFCENISEAAKLGDREAVTVFCKSCGKINDTIYFANDHKKSDKYHAYYYKVNFISNLISPFDINYFTTRNDTTLLKEFAKAVDRRYNAVFRPDNKGIYSKTEEPVSYPGGDSALKIFIKKNLSIPDRIKTQRLKGKVIIDFIVNEDGSLSDIKLYNGMPDCMQCSSEALKMAKLMPNWNPGKMKGKVVKCYKYLTVDFE